MPLSLQNAMKALYKSATKIGSIGNVWGSSPKCPYFMMQFIEQPLFPKCFHGQSYLCVDTGGLLSNALTAAFGMDIEYFWTGDSLAV